MKIFKNAFLILAIFLSLTACGTTSCFHIKPHNCCGECVK